MPVSSAARRGRLARDLRATWEIVPSPVRTLRGALPRSPVLVPWLVVSLLTMALTLPQVSIAQRAAVHLLEDRAGADHADAIAASLSRMKVSAVLGAPIAVLLRWTVTASALWAPAALFAAAGLPFRRVLSIVALAGVPALLGHAVDLGVAWTEGPEFTPDLVPVMSSATSLSALLPPDTGGPWLTALLAKVTPFSLWATALWAAGLRVAGLRPGAAIAIATAAAAGILVLTASVDAIGRSLLAATGSPG